MFVSLLALLVMGFDFQIISDVTTWLFDRAITRLFIHIINEIQCLLAPVRERGFSCQTKKFKLL